MNHIETPVRLLGNVVKPVWSGTALSRMFGRFNKSGTIGEVWETSTNSNTPAIAVFSDGTTLPFPEYLITAGLDSPPLVKLIDAGESLSVQVHPDDISAMKLGGVSKSELWYVLRAEPNASLIYGTVPGLSADEVRSSVRNGISDKILNIVDVSAGDIFMIPHGMIHSLGKGITVLEIQDRPGSTYRLRDYAGGRELHLEEGEEAVRIYTPEEAAAQAFNSASRLRKLSLPGEVIAATDGFAASILRENAISSAIQVDSGVYMFCCKGLGSAGNIDFSAGESLFFAEKAYVEISADTEVVFVI